MVRHKYNKYCGIFALTTICAYTLSFLPAIADDVIQNEENNNNNNNKSYTLVETTESDKSQNVIVKYEYNKETGLLTPKYYKVNLIKTTYGNENGTKTISIDTPYSVSGNITYKYNPIDTTTPSNERLENTTDNSDKTTTGNFFNLNSDTITQGGAINNTGLLGDINSSFQNNSLNLENLSETVQGGAIYNNGIIGNVTGDFIQNYATISIAEQEGYSKGGAIYNDGEIGDIAGDFIQNHASATSENDYVNSYGGAVFNDYYGTINNITGDFIKNYASATSENSAANANGGAVYNEYSSSIFGITGDFIQNYASATSENDYANAYGGAIINNSNAHITNINSDFVQNYASATSVSSDANAFGGAVYNYDDAHITNINGDFIKNYAIATSENANANARGGAIYQQAAEHTIENIVGDFIQNYANANGVFADAAGGAISNTSSVIGSIKGDFINNYTSSTGKEEASAYGGAIDNGSLIRNIDGDFISNSAIAESETDSEYSRAGAFGGAIFNSGIIGSQNKPNNSENGSMISNSLFANNKVVANANFAQAMGGAVYQYGSGNYNENTQYAESIIIKKNDGTSIYLTNADSNFKNAVLNGEDTYLRTETYTESYILDRRYGNDSIEEFIAERYPDYTEENINKFYIENYNKKENTDPAFTFTNSSFINNSAIANGDSADAKGGAIYSVSNIKIEANNGYHSLISGNYTEINGVKDENAIYMAANPESIEHKTEYDYDKNTSNTSYDYSNTYKTQASSLTLEANTKGIIQIDDKISGEKGGMIYETTSYYDDPDNRIIIKEADENYKIYITGDNTGTVILNNDVEGEADMYLYQTTLKLGKRDDVLKNNNMTFNSGTFDMVNNNIGSTNFNTLTLNDNIKTKADVDLINETMDRITSDNYIINENKLNDKLISVDYLNLLNDSTKDSVKILYADEEISSNVEYIGSNPIQVDEDKIAYSPIYKYTVSYDIDENDNMGYFTFNRGNINDSNSYNPSVLAPSVSSQAGAYTTQLQTLEYAFKHSDAFMALPSFERMAIINADRYALTPTSDATDIGTFSPLMTKLDVSGFWVKPYTSFESIPLNNGPKVSNISYGTLVGYDSNLKHLKNGWERVLTGYIGYNGASQRYSGIDTYQNGGILGLTTTFYKNNFFNATTISTGAAVGDSSTYYGDEDYTMLTAGIGNKFGYNFEFKDGKFILQPNLLLSYTFINTFDYTNAAGLKIKSDPLHALQIAPGIKFIMNTESGWQPYLRADMIWNILDKTKVTANDVRLPEMSIDPYVQYGIGVQKLFKNERLTFFGQALVQNGGRNGVSLNAGLRWAVGRGE